jgi:hypothetical protein
MEHTIETKKKHRKLSDEWRLIINLATIHALVVAKPLFDTFASYPEYFVVNRISSWSLIGFVLTISFAAPLILTSFVIVVQKIRFAWGNFLQSIVIVFYGFGYTLQLIKGVDFFSGTIYVAIASMAGIGLAVLYSRNERMSFVVTLVSPIILIFPLVFFGTGDIQRILSPPKTALQSDGTNGAAWTQSRPRIVFVVLDEFPLTDLLDERGDINSKLFPNFSNLEKESTWYENATTTWPFTIGALTGTLTGNRPPMWSVLPSYDYFPRNLFSMVQNHYTLDVTEPITDLLPKEFAQRSRRGTLTSAVADFRVLTNDAYVVYLHILLPKKLTRTLPRIDESWGRFGEKLNSGDGLNLEPGGKQVSKEEFLANEDILEKRLEQSLRSNRKAQFESFIRSLDRYPKSTLHFFHTVFPHSPFEYLPSGKIYTDFWPKIGIYEETPVWKGSEGAVERVHQGLRLQEALADHFVGLLVKELKEKNLYDDCLLIITADHGASFIDNHSKRMPDRDNFGDIAFVPLFIKYPGQISGKRDESNVELIDIVPTIKDVIGAEIDWEFEGRSLVNVDTIPKKKKVLPKFGGGTLQLSQDEYVDSKQKALARKVESFSLDDPRSDLFRYGPGLEYVGQPESILYDKLVEGSYQCDGIKALTNIDLNQNILPCRLIGTVSSASENPLKLYLAFVVNGVIEVVSKPMESNNQYLFDVVLPEEVFVQGKNTVNILLTDLDGILPKR